MVPEVTVQKNSKQTFPWVKKVTVKGLAIVFWQVTFNPKVKYWASAYLLFLNKNLMWDGFTKNICKSP